MRWILSGGAVLSDQGGDERRVACRPLTAVLVRTSARRTNTLTQTESELENQLGQQGDRDTATVAERKKRKKRTKRLFTVKRLLEMLTVIVGLIGAILALLASLRK